MAGTGGPDVVYPILKFSHATGVRSDNTIPWTHLSADNLFVVVNGSNDRTPHDNSLISHSGRGGALTMRVVQGTKVLESLNVAHYIDLALSARRTSETAEVMVRLKVEQLPIFGITKESLLAIRYRLDNGEARRLQLRLRNPSECQHILTVFSQRGMEFQEQAPATRGGTAGARPGTGRPQSRPLTVQSSSGSPYFEQAAPTVPRASPFMLQSIEAGSLSHSHSRPTSPERPPTHTNAVYEMSGNTTQEMPPPSHFFTRDEVSAPREVVATRPTTAMIYRSYTAPSQPPQHDVPIPEAVHRDQLAGRPSSVSRVSTIGGTVEAAAEYGTFPGITSGMSEVMAEGFQQRPVHSHSKDDWFSGDIVEQTNSNISHANISYQSSVESPTRLSTPATTAIQDIPDTLEHEIPPRRELPFGKNRPESRRQESEKEKHTSSSRPSTSASALALPPLPRPTSVRASPTTSPTQQIPVPGDVSSVNDASPVRPSTASAKASPLKRSFDVYNDKESSPKAERVAHMSHQSPTRDVSPTKVLSPPIPEDPAVAESSPTRKLSPMNELLARQKQKPLSILSEHSINGNASLSRVSRLDSLADAPHELEPSNPPLATASPVNFATNDPFRFPVQRGETQALKEYAQQSREDRIATMDEFMCANLENDAFRALCEDVEGCWRRIALGL